MAANTPIEWAANQDGTPGATWNPIRARDIRTGRTGTFCVHASEGCRNCYAETFQGRKLPGNGIGLPYTAPNLAHVEHYIDEAMLSAPLRRRKPTTYFLSSMTDVFGEWVPDDMLDRVFAKIVRARAHTFIVVTKRAARMREWMMELQTAVGAMHEERSESKDGRYEARELSQRFPHIEEAFRLLPAKTWQDWPLPNVCLMVSGEDQRTADERIPHLLATPARWRAVSCEPMLGAVHLTRIPTPCLALPGACCGDRAKLDALRGIQYCSRAGAYGWPDRVTSPLRRLDWVIVGGESGPNARPMHPDWARSLRDQCAQAGVPFFFKQHGHWLSGYDRDRDDPDWAHCSQISENDPRGQWLNLKGGQGFHGERVVWVSPVGKHAAGRILDGIEHNARPDFWSQR